MNFFDDRLPPHFWSKAMPEPNSGCWLWVAALQSHGYGVIRVDGNTRYAARLTYEASRGPIGEELELKNLCAARCCINPAHWRALTRRAIVRSGFEANKTHCKNGHEFTPENTYRRWGGGRMCLACSAGRQRLSVKAKKWRRDNSLRDRLRRRFGMSVADLESMWSAQNGQCPICLVVMTRTGGRRDSMHIDHDHASGVVRGLLCMLCNNALGSLRDNPDAARRAASYLESGGQPSRRKQEHMSNEQSVPTAPPEHIMQFFAHAHLPPHLAAVSAPFAELAERVVVTLPRNPERTVALRKLLEAKDAAVRALVAK